MEWKLNWKGLSLTVLERIDTNDLATFLMGCFSAIIHYAEVNLHEAYWLNQ